jgi:nitroreductase
VNVVEAIRSRKSIRGYKPDRVPTDVLEELLKIAAQAPSSRNFQPWKADIITGEVLEKIKHGNVTQLSAGVVPHADVLIENQNEAREPAFRQRQIAVAKQLFQAMGIPREDMRGRTEWALRGFRFYDAPAAMILSSSDALSDAVMAFNVALFAQTLCLAAMDFQLGSCIAQQGISYPEVIRRHTGIPESERIVIGISIGYPDPDFAPNDVLTRREPVNAFTRWHGFVERPNR